MTPTQQLEYIRSKCIEANQSIKDLVFGCIVEYKPLRALRIPDRYGVYVGEGRGKDSVNIWFDGADSGSQKPYTVFLKINHIEIIGRHIRLADVLLAIEKADMSESKKEDCIKILVFGGLFYENRYDLRKDCYWNLLFDDINLQSDATKKLIFELLRG